MMRSRTRASLGFCSEVRLASKVRVDRSSWCSCMRGRDRFVLDPKLYRESHRLHSGRTTRKSPHDDSCGHGVEVEADEAARQLAVACGSLRLNYHRASRLAAQLLAPVTKVKRKLEHDLSYSVLIRDPNEGDIGHVAHHKSNHSFSHLFCVHVHVTSPE